ncbi:MAG: imidazole glycerol phosphate synthase subunit HisH [Ignavibacteriaceae bacterium]
MIALIDLGDQNTGPTAKILKELWQEFIITSNEIEICKADSVILTGYGGASAGVKQLHLRNLFSVMRIIRKPFLGIGLGMHLMAEYSSEGNVSCLGLFKGSTEKFNEKVSNVKHSGFNTVKTVNGEKLFKGISSDDKFFFDHSYYLPLSGYTTSVSANGIEFSASLEKENLYAVQFHPEKSGEAGLKLLRNFAAL